MTKKEEKSSLPGSVGEHKLQKVFFTESKAEGFYNKQMLDYLSQGMQEFINKQSMVFISTSDKHGECDCSLRTGKNGFILVLDKHRLIYPEFKGNGVMASMGNISENAHIGLLFLDFLEDKVGLHVNGSVKFLSKFDMDTVLDKASLEKVNNLKLTKKQVSWILVEVEEAYIHCSKNIPLFKENKDKEELNKARPVDYFKLS